MSASSAPGQRRAAGGGVHPQVAVDQRRRRPRPGAVAAQHRPDPQHQLAGAERLAHVVVGAQLQAADPVVLLAERGQHDDRGRRLPGRAAPGTRRARWCPGSIRSSTTASGRSRAAASQGALAVRRHVDPVAGVAEVPGDDVADGRVVVHHEHAVGHPASVATRRRRRRRTSSNGKAERGVPSVVRGPTVESVTRTEPGHGPTHGAVGGAVGAGRPGAGASPAAAAAVPQPAARAVAHLGVRRRPARGAAGRDRHRACSATSPTGRSSGRRSRATSASCTCPWFDWPASPSWLYRLTQGLHVGLGLVLVPVVLAKLWSVAPKLFALAAGPLARAGAGARCRCCCSSAGSCSRSSPGC